MERLGDCTIYNEAQSNEKDVILNNMAGIDLYLGSCLDILPRLISDGRKVDLVCCDPPYRITSRGNSGNSGGMLTDKRSMSGRIFDDNDCPVSQWMPLIYDILNDGRHCYLMCNNLNLIEYLNTAETCGFHFIKSLIWHKNNKIMGRAYVSEFEYVLFFRKGEFRQVNDCGVGDVISVPFKKLKDADGNNLHDTEKPVDLMKILVGNSTLDGETVLDFAMGIGSTGIASKMLGRGFIGIEINEKYYDIASERISGVDAAGEMKAGSLW